MSRTLLRLLSFAVRRDHGSPIHIKRLVIHCISTSEVLTLFCCSNSELRATCSGENDLRRVGCCGKDEATVCRRDDEDEGTFIFERFPRA